MSRQSKPRRFSFPAVLLTATIVFLGTTTAIADEVQAPVPQASQLSEIAYAFDNTVLLICAVLVLLMQAGFAMLEVGLNSAKNTINILAKNVMDLAVGVLIFFAIGFSIMYPGEAYKGGWFGFSSLGVASEAPEIGAGNLHPQVDFLFQAAFAATAATIVSGAVAGRMKFTAYVIYSAILTGLIYPIGGMWKWGGGWLDALGFHDFAGSVLVHAVGGFAGLAGAIVLGPRLGRFATKGKNPFPAHNLAFAALGVFVLWVGWYGFNPGSQLAFSSAADTAATMTIAVNTTLAAGAGTVLALVVAWAWHGKPDLVMAFNGALAGLVGITASCDMVSNVAAVGIGAVAGILVVAATVALEKLKIDDPVGAWPVHGVCGIWGGLAAGIFGTAALGAQLIGIAAIIGWAFVTMLCLFLVLRAVGLLRVEEEVEERGLDITEHGATAYGTGDAVPQEFVPTMQA